MNACLSMKLQTTNNKKFTLLNNPVAAQKTDIFCETMPLNIYPTRQEEYSMPSEIRLAHH